MEYAEKLIHLKANLNNVETMLEGTDFVPVPLSQASPVLITSPNPHAYAIIDKSQQSVIPGLIVFLSFGDSEICIAKCWKTMDDPTDHESVHITKFAEKDKLVDFIRSKAELFAAYMDSLAAQVVEADPTAQELHSLMDGFV